MDNTTAGPGPLLCTGGGGTGRTREGLLLFGDRLEWKIVPATTAVPTRSEEFWKGLGLADFSKRGQESYIKVPARQCLGAAGRLFIGWGGGKHRYEASANPLRLLRRRLEEEGRYPVGAPLAYLAEDNFVDPSLLVGCGLDDLHRQQMTLLANMVRQQLDEADQLMKKGFGVPAHPQAFMRSAEFVHDLPVPNAHLSLRSLETTMRGLAVKGYLGWDRGSETLKVRHDEYHLTVYTKTPTLLRFQVKLNDSRAVEKYSGAKILPTTPEGWAQVFARVESAFEGNFLALLNVVRGPGPSEVSAVDLLMALIGVVGCTRDRGLAREFVDQFLASGAINNTGRRFKAMLDRAVNVGLMEKGERGQWVLARRFEWAARRLVEGSCL